MSIIIVLFFQKYIIEPINKSNKKKALSLVKQLIGYWDKAEMIFYFINSKKATNEFINLVIEEITNAIDTQKADIRNINLENLNKGFEKIKQIQNLEKNGTDDDFNKLLECL